MVPVCKSPQPPGFVTDTPRLSRHVTDDVTDDLEKNLGKIDLVTLSRLKTPGRGCPSSLIPNLTCPSFARTVRELLQRVALVHGRHALEQGRH
jgi:hypothetical protein